MNRFTYTFILVILALVPCTLYAADTEQKDGLYAKFETSKGEIMISLFYEEMPISVGNFVALAEGKNKKNLLEEYKKKHFYDGVTFDRKIGDFMIPSKNAYLINKEGIGYSLPVEINDSLSILPNILMLTSNTGENNGSQLSFSFRPIPFFTGASTPIGQIVTGVDVAQSLSNGDKLTTVDIVRVGKKAKRFNANKVVAEEIEILRLEEEKYKSEEYNRTVESLELLAQSDDEAYQEFAKRKLFALEKAEVLESGVRMIKSRETEGVFPTKGESIRVNYTGYLPDGTIIDSSYKNPRPLLFLLGEGKVIKGWEEVFPLLRVGEKATIFVPSSSAYGKNGAGKIRPYTTLIFDITLESIEE